MSDLHQNILNYRNPFIGHLGLQCEHAEHGRVVMALDVRPEQRNGAGNAHGGVVMTMLDACLGLAAMSTDAQFRLVVTLNLSTSFVRAGKGRLVVEGRVVGGGRSIVFCEGEIRDEEGAVVATAQGSFKFTRPQAD
ncbi:MAG: PaaI family thioesterase [Rhodocyclaceae bacterium]|jgi:uncharacterized protein (TIGR00369 family)|nr:PaaI family thioesterase [Rhodocyclaceae bacterium]